jgi:hypothetical protein
MLTTERTYVFVRNYLTNSRNYIGIQNQLTCYHNRDGKCLLCGAR